MKKYIYISLFTILGILISFLVHVGIEIQSIKLLISDFGTWSFGLSWKSIILIHSIGSVGLLFIGAISGIWQGIYWWKRIYS